MEKNVNQRVVAGVDIGGTKIAVGVVDSEGKVLARMEGPTEAKGPYRAAIERTKDMLRAVVNKSGCEIAGIGIGSTGPIAPETGQLGDVNHFPHWCGENPVKDLHEAFHLPVAVENDGDAAALAEAAWGSGKNRSSVIYVTVGTGIGVGIILNGEVYRGVDQSHPEIGHHVIDSTGPLCDCGFQGCWESLAAGPALVRFFKANVPENYPHRESLTGREICELARRGDEIARKTVKREAHYLGLGLANLVTIFVPEAIVLGGSVMKSADLFLEDIRRIIAQSCRYVPHPRTELRLASLGEDTNLIGAARVWYYRFGSGGNRVG